VRDICFPSAHIADNSVRHLLGVFGKKNKQGAVPRHEPVKLLFLGHIGDKIYNNIYRIEDNLKENIRRRSSVSPSAGRLAMDSVIIRDEA
jgi:hypothetical protein